MRPRSPFAANVRVTDDGVDGTVLLTIQIPELGLGGGTEPSILHEAIVKPPSLQLRSLSVKQTQIVDGDTRKVRQLYRPRQTDPTVFVYAHLCLADKDETFAWLEKAYSQHSNSMTTLKVDPIYDPLRGDRRSLDLLRRVGRAE